MKILQFPSPPTDARTTRRETSRSARVDRWYPRRFHPLRESFPILMPVLITLIGGMLAIGAAAAVVEVHRASYEASPDAEAPLPSPR